MLDVLDNPSFINPWVLPTITSQVPQGLIQPVPQPRGARPKEGVRPKLKGNIPSNQSEVSSTADLIKTGRTAAQSTVTSVGPSVSQVGDPSSVENPGQMYMNDMIEGMPKDMTTQYPQVIQRMPNKR